MSSPRVDFINIDNQPLQSCSNEYGTYNFRRTNAYLLKTQGIHVTTAQRLYTPYGSEG